MSRFDYVKYDKQAMDLQDVAKSECQSVESLIQSIGVKNVGPSARAKALAFTKLEECYMWIGKAIRDDQVARNNGESS